MADLMYELIFVAVACLNVNPSGPPNLVSTSGSSSMNNSLLALGGPRMGGATFSPGGFGWTSRMEDGGRVLEAAFSAGMLCALFDGMSCWTEGPESVAPPRGGGNIIGRGPPSLWVAQDLWNFFFDPSALSGLKLDIPELSPYLSLASESFMPTGTPFSSSRIPLLLIA